MKRIVVFLAMALMAFSVAQAESEQDSTFVFGPADTENMENRKKMVADRFRRLRVRFLSGG